MFKTLTPKTDY